MEHETINSENHEDDDLEDGELDSTRHDDDYVVLERPNIQNQLSVRKGDLDEISDTDDYLRTNSSDTCDSDTSNSYRKKLKRSPRPKIRPSHSHGGMKLKSNKYNIWSEGLQEDDLTENLQGCDVTSGDKIDRSVESYNYTLKFRHNSEKNLKRRQSNSDDSEMNYCAKRFKNLNSKSENKARRRKRNGEDNKNRPRVILDLTTTENCTNEEVANDIANKLCEKKDNLLLRIINTIGKQIPLELFKDTQKIESEGGMMIMNNERRRTPGGVFLFLLKHNSEISSENKKHIFADEREASLKDKKRNNVANRELKVEELKRKLKNKSLPKLDRRDKFEMSHLKPEIPYCMSNPPPSPVNEAPGNSSDYDTHTIQHVNVTTPEKLTTPDNIEPSSSRDVYDDDFLDINCEDMELF